MNFWQTTKKWLTDGCVWFSVFALAFLFFNLMLSGTEDAQSISPSAFLRIFPCGLCFSLAGMLRHNEKLPLWSRVILHYIIDVLAVFLLLYLPTAIQQAATRLLMFVLISVIYWIIVGTVALVRSRVRKLMEED